MLLLPVAIPVRYRVILKSKLEKVSRRSGHLASPALECPDKQRNDDSDILLLVVCGEKY